MKENSLPEEKLLRLIRGKKNPEVAVTGVPGGTAIKNSLKISFFMPDAVRHLITLRRVIFFLLVLACMYLAYTFVSPLLEAKNGNFPIVSESEAVVGLDKEVKNEAKPFESYLEGIQGKQIFSVGTMNTPDAGLQQAAVNAEKIKDITLMGVISGDNPQAIIEDKKLQKTFYLAPGQLIGDFKVEEIQEGKVVLSFNGQKYELYL